MEVRLMVVHSLTDELREMRTKKFVDRFIPKLKIIPVE